MGQYRSKPDKTKNTEYIDSQKYTYAATSMCGWRLTMQDAHITNPKLNEKNFGLFAVFDGHGGQQVAKFAQTHFTSQLVDNENFRKGNYEKALVQTFIKIDSLLMSPQGKKQIKQLTKKTDKNSDQQSFAGCTANVCLFTDKQLYVANAGDSRSIAVGKDKTYQMSIDHKPEDTIQYKRITNAGGTVIDGRVNGNLNLSRALGDLQYKQNKNLKPQEQIISAKPDVKKMSLSNVDFVVMGCDGIWQCKSNEQIGRYFNEGIKMKKKLKELNQTLLDSLLAKDTKRDTGLDNMTVISIICKK